MKTINSKTNHQIQLRKFSEKKNRKFKGKSHRTEKLIKKKKSEKTLKTDPRHWILLNQAS